MRMTPQRMQHLLHLVRDHKSRALARARRKHGLLVFTPCGCDLCRTAQRWLDSAVLVARR